MNKFATLVIFVLFSVGCSNPNKVSPKEITKEDCVEVELAEIGMRLFLPAEFVEINNLYRLKTTIPGDNLTPKELLESQAMKTRLFGLNGDSSQLLFLLYGDGAPEVEITKATAGMISGYLKEKSIRSNWMQGKKVKYGKSTLSILPKVSFLKLNGTYSVFGTSEKGFFNLIMLSSKYESVMLMMQVKKEIPIEKYLALTELI